MEYKIYETALGTYLLKPDLISESLKVGNFWEEELFPVFERLDSEMIAVEVGSYIGDHTIDLARRCKKIYAFECNTFNYYQLCANLLLNNSTNVKAYNTCIGISNSKIKFLLKAEGNNAGTVYKKDNDGNIIVYSLDDLLLEKLDRLDYLLIDVEGMDLDVLMGAQKLIEKHSPIINFEFNEHHTDYTIEDYILYLTNLGYTVSKIGVWNWLAEH